MARTVGIGIQSFEKLIRNHCFYIDKTYFIKEWWENQDEVTLITRPRRFGKTLNLDMLEHFFSIRYKDQGHLFEGLSIWKEERYRALQGTYPVIALSFADVKASSFQEARRTIFQIIKMAYERYPFLLDSEFLTESEKEDLRKIVMDTENSNISLSLKMLSCYLSRHYGKKVLILLDEYDTPLQEAYVYGYWKELTAFIRSLFNSTFKTNPYLERGVMTGIACPALSGITRVSTPQASLGKESIFSDLNHLTVVTSTSEQYADCFGFTQQEVWNALDEYGLSGEKDNVKSWYDGFTFGTWADIYNPWSIINYLRTKKLSAYWANSSSNALADKLIREGSPAIKHIMEDLLKGESLSTKIDEPIIFHQLDQDEDAIWSLFLASGYLKVDSYATDEDGEEYYTLSLTNKEVRIMFKRMIGKWFSRSKQDYNGFIRAMLRGDCKEMNAYMTRVALSTFSYFDTGKKPSEAAEPERFYHGFVLGLTVDLADRYAITSNRESGFGRYDVMLEPRHPEDPGIVMEFKVRDPEDEKTLEDTAKKALDQIRRQDYAAALRAQGIDAERIFQYGFAFEGKTVRIRKA